MEKTLVYIILVNWNGWKDTIECLESIFSVTSYNYRVIVCDNDSNDDSLSQIKAWADSNIHIESPHNDGKESQSLGEIKSSRKSFYREIDSTSYTKRYSDIQDRDFDETLILMSMGSNLGFGRANNIAMKYAFQNRAEYVWLLNNDSVISESSIERMLRTAAQYEESIVGSIIKYYDHPEKVQAYGGGYVSMLTGKITTEIISPPSPTQKLNFITGASLMINKSIYKKVGGFDENIFMYFEDIDLCLRASAMGIGMACSDAEIYHKVGSSNGGEGNYFSWFNGYKNKYYSLLKINGLGLWTVFYWLSIFVVAFFPYSSSTKHMAARHVLRDFSQRKLCWFPYYRRNQERHP